MRCSHFRVAHTTQWNGAGPIAAIVAVSPEAAKDVADDGLKKRRNSVSPEAIETRNAYYAQESVPEVSLHRFFQSLPVTYRLYQADNPDDLAKAVAEVGRQQNFPLDYDERIPRQDHSRAVFAVAALCCALLLVHRSLLLRSWL